MSLTTKTLIATTVAITKMNYDEIQAVLLDILASNPTVVYGAMNVAAPHATYKVICDGKQTNKIGIIKEFRSLNGVGLADSKAWSEGTLAGHEAGVYRKGLTREEADRIAADINHRGSHQHTYNGYGADPTGLRVKVVRDSEPTNYHASWEVAG